MALFIAKLSLNPCVQDEFEELKKNNIEQSTLAFTTDYWSIDNVIRLQRTKQFPKFKRNQEDQDIGKSCFGP